MWIFCIRKKGNICEVCLVEINESFMKYGDYESLEELVRKEQLLFSYKIIVMKLIGNHGKYLRNEITPILKDGNWEPVLTQE